MKRLLYYLKPNSKLMIFGFTIKTVGTMLDLFLPLILANIIDTVVPTENVSSIILWGIAMIACSIGAVVLSIAANRIASRVAGNCTRAIRHDLFGHIFSLSTTEVDRLTVSSLESRLTVDTYNVHQMINLDQRLGVRAPVLFIGGIIMTFILDFRLTFVMLSVLPFVTATIWIVSKKGIPIYTELQGAIDKMTSVIRENTSGVRTIKALRKSDFEKQRFDEVNKEAINKEKRAGVTMASTNPIVTFFLNLGLAAVILVGAALVFDGKSTNGKIIAFISYFTIISNALINVSRIFTVSSKGLSGMNRIDKVLKLEALSFEPNESVAGSIYNECENDIPFIRFDHVSFSYPGGHGQTVLSDISFEISKGRTLGIIGTTGSGKSTIISLLLNEYEPTSGKIYISEKTADRNISLAIKDRIGVVFQNDFILSDTVSENVRFGRNMSDEDVERALKNACADFVFDYPDGTDHHIDIKGANLSGGQKQRLLIARAIAGKPDILIFDDASSALDYSTDARLRRSIKENYAGITSIIIAQRVSSIMHADLIIVLESGKTVAIGTHDQLIAGCSQYREIYEAQMGGDFDLE